MPLRLLDVGSHSTGLKAMRDMPTIISICVAGEIAHVRISGRLVAGAEVEMLRDTVLRAGANYQVLVLNLREVEKIDAAGLSALLFAHGVAESLGARFKPAAVPRRIQEVLEITRLNTVLANHAVYGRRTFTERL